MHPNADNLIASRFDTVIYDLDGTLIDSARDMCVAVSRVLADHGLPAISDEDARQFMGEGSKVTMRRAFAKAGRTLDEAGKLEPGDVLVCHMTMPAWTPLFATVSAVVADSGGVLSHCSIVAREYGIPCVTATRTGTRLLKDGQTVVVDGTRGIVQVK